MQMDERDCRTCEHLRVMVEDEPCVRCASSHDRPMWEPASPGRDRDYDDGWEEYCDE